jgi:hypothetical protein
VDVRVPKKDKKSLEMEGKFRSFTLDEIECFETLSAAAQSRGVLDKNFRFFPLFLAFC